MTFPRTVRALHQLEISSRCNLRCAYCPSRDMVDGKYPNRPTGDMTRETFLRALEWVKFYVRNGTQTELNIAGIGESTLHSEFIDFVRLAREAIPNGTLIFATNGVIHDEEMVRAIAPYKPIVCVSLHRPEKAGLAVQMYKKYGIFHGVSANPSLDANDWAGQVNWFNDIKGYQMRCQWLQDGKAFVMSDGRISSCCLDAQGIGVIGHVNDPIGSVETKPYGLCATCYQAIDDDSWDQKKGCAK